MAGVECHGRDSVPRERVGSGLSGDVKSKTRGSRFSLMETGQVLAAWMPFLRLNSLTFFPVLRKITT